MADILDLDIKSIIYIGGFLDESSKIQLREIISNQFNYELDKFKEYLSHITFFFNSKTPNMDIFEKLPLPNQQIKINICSLVIRKNDNSCAFLINSIKDEDDNDIVIQNTYPHISAYLPNGIQPVESNNFVGIDDETVNCIPIDIKFNVITQYICRKSKK
jgi:hypothetical protein